MSTGRDDDRTWAELVNAFHAEPDPDDHTRRWPEAEDVDDQAERNDDDLSDRYYTASPEMGGVTSSTQSEQDQPADSQRSEVTGESEESDHFVPPTPPPIPRGDRITRWAWTGMVAPPSVLLLASITGWSPSDEAMMVLIGGFIAGFGTLVARMRGHSPHDPDNGAVV